MEKPPDQKNFLFKNLTIDTAPKTIRYVLALLVKKYDATYKFSAIPNGEKPPIIEVWINIDKYDIFITINQNWAEIRSKTELIKTHPQNDGQSKYHYRNKFIFTRQYSKAILHSVEAAVQEAENNIEQSQQ